MRRRALLSALASGAVAGLGGCADEDNGGTTLDVEGCVDAEFATRTPAAPRTGSGGWSDTDPPDGPVRCRGAPVSVERTIVDEPGYGDGFEYFPGNDTLRKVVARSGDDPAVVRRVPFGEWASYECVAAGKGRVREAAADRLGADGFASAGGAPPNSVPTDERVVFVRVTKVVDDGRTVRTPTLSFARLAEVAPSWVRAAVSLEGTGYCRVIPVFAEFSVTERGPWES